MKKIIIIQLALAALIIGGYVVYTKVNPTEIEIIERESYSRISGIQNDYKTKPVPDSIFNILNPDQTNLNEPKLVFRFSQIYCGTCVTREIRLLREFAREIGWENIIFLATNSDEAYLRRFQRVSQVQTPIHNITYDFFGVDQEHLDTPYMFILDSDSSFKDLFISMKENEVRTQQYLEKIRSYF